MDLPEASPTKEQGRRVQFSDESAKLQRAPTSREEFVPTFYGRQARKQDLLFKCDQPSKDIMLGKLQKSILSTTSRRELPIMSDLTRVQAGRKLVVESSLARCSERSLDVRPASARVSSAMSARDIGSPRI